MCEEELPAWLKQVCIGREAGDEALAKERLICHTREAIEAPLKGSIITLELEEGHPNSGWRIGGKEKGRWRDIC